MPERMEIFRVTGPDGFATLFCFLQSNLPGTYDDLETLCSAADSGTSYYMVMAGNRTAGAYSLTECSHDSLRIRDFYTDRTAADFALAFLIGQASDAGYQKVQVCVTEDDTCGIRFFRNQGFKPVRTFENNTLGMMFLQLKLQ